MSAIAQFTAFILTAVAALITLTAAIATTQNESITTSGYLLLLGSLLLALATGTGIITVLGLYLANIVLIAGLLLTYALFKRSTEEGVPVTRLIRQLRANIRAQRNPPTFHDNHPQRQRTPGQTQSSDPANETGRQPYPPTTDEHGRPIVFEDQL